MWQLVVNVTENFQTWTSDTRDEDIYCNFRVSGWGVLQDGGTQSFSVIFSFIIF